MPSLALVLRACQFKLGQGARPEMYGVWSEGSVCQAHYQAQGGVGAVMDSCATRATVPWLSLHPQQSWSPAAK